MNTDPTTEPSRKQKSHDRIVDAAARAIRARGYAGVGVADVMREAGLTHGGFYAHFPSREALLVAALDRAGRTSGESLRRYLPPAGESGAFRAFVDAYLADALLDAPEAGCPIAALCSEMPRQAAPVRAASADRVRGLVRHVRKVLPASSTEDAPVVAATLVGALQMARALDDPTAGRRLLAAARASLMQRYDA